MDVSNMYEVVASPAMSITSIIPAGWTFNAMGAEAAALLGTGLVTGLVFLVLALRVGPKIVRAFKSIGR